MSAVMQAGLRKSPRNNRAFSYAVLASVLLHGALLFAVPGLREGKRQSAVPGPIVARLVQPPSAPAAPQAEPQPEPPKPQVEPPPAPVVASTPKPNPLAKTQPKTLPGPAAPQQPTPTAPPVAPAPPASAATAPGPVARTEPQPDAPPASVDVGSLEIYRMELIRMARKYKRYPRAALDNSWEGQATVRMVIGANGLIASLTVITSSGHEILDKSAIDMFQKAKGAVPLPPAMRGKESVLEFPVIFSLKE